MAILSDEVAKREAHIRELCDKHGIEMDRELTELTHAVAEGMIISGIGKLINKDWIICQELKLFAQAKRDSTRQRILEHLSDLQGYMPRADTSKANLWADVIIGDTNA